MVCAWYVLWSYTPSMRNLQLSPGSFCMICAIAVLYLAHVEQLFLHDTIQLSPGFACLHDILFLHDMILTISYTVLQAMWLNPVHLSPESLPIMPYVSCVLELDILRGRAVPSGHLVTICADIARADIAQCRAGTN